MNCFYHPDRPAIGVCNYCQRGLCPDSAAFVEDVLACRDRHEEQVRQIQIWRRAGIAQYQRLRAGYVRNAIFYGLVALLFVGFGLYQLHFLGLEAVFFISIGVFLLYASIANLVESLKRP